MVGPASNASWTWRYVFDPFERGGLLLDVGTRGGDGEGGFPSGHPARSCGIAIVELDAQHFGQCMANGGGHGFGAHTITYR